MTIKTDNELLKKGTERLQDYIETDLSEKFNSIEYVKSDKNTVELKDGNLTVKYTTVNDAYALLGLALSKSEQAFSSKLNRKIERAGIMLDCARNASVRKETAERLIAINALLGYNYFELYVEDCLEVDGEPYLGYMRGRVTQEEIKELDSFADQYGVELIPCIQTLAHLGRLLFHWREYYAILDKNDVLLVDEDRTYLLIENIIKTCRKCFKSKRINIGMDEAFDLGLGKYLDKHGYEDKSKIIRRHLNKVLGICKKYDFNPSMWADMFYKDIENGSKDIPEGVNLIYWSYGNGNSEVHDKRFEGLKKSGAHYSCAGGIIKFAGYAPYTKYSENGTRALAGSAIKYGVNDFMMTSWGDDGGEAAQLSILGGNCYFAHINFGLDNEYLQNVCKAICGYTYDEFVMLDNVNKLFDGDYAFVNPSKCLMFADLFIGVEEVAALPEYPERYAKISSELLPLAKRESSYNYLFETLYRLSKFMELKSYAVEELYFAYQEKNKQKLKEISKKIPEMCKRLKKFIEVHEIQWRKENKNFGFEIQQIRLNGILIRLEFVKGEIDKFLKGKIDRIEELEEKKYFEPLKNVKDGETYKGQLYNMYAANVTYGKI